MEENNPDTSFRWLANTSPEAIRLAAASIDPCPQFLSLVNNVRKTTNSTVQMQTNTAPSLENLAQRFKYFRLGDNVICTQNVYDRETKKLLVANGCFGRIGFDGLKTFVHYSNSFRDEYEEPRGFISKFELSGCITVDKSQGAEFPTIVVLVVGKRTGGARLLYTAFSRAQKQCLLLGSAEDIMNMTSTVDKLDASLLDVLKPSTNKNKNKKRKREEDEEEEKD
jgi:ATP-dependent exoDNAse (exonuclease V) alpha subunit